MKAAGRTITAGELIEHFSVFDQNDHVYLDIYGDREPIERLVSNTVCGADDDHIYQSAHLLIKELQEFKGTKKDLVARIAEYPY